MTTDAENWQPLTFTLWFDTGTYGSTPDEDEMAYLSRMGGIDAMTEEEAEQQGLTTGEAL